MNVPGRPLQPPHLELVARDEDDVYDEWRQKQLDQEREMKLCIDCAWFIVNGSKCGRAPAEPDYVRGHPTENFYAQIERQSKSEKSCGPEARFFKVIPVAA